MNGTGGQSGGTNLVMNGDFSNGANGWGLPAMMGQVSQSVTNGQFCVMLQQLGSVTIGYPSGGVAPFQIIGGASYTFSYQASSTGNLVIEAKVGQTHDAVRRHRFRLHERVGQRIAVADHATRSRADRPTARWGCAFNLSGGPGTFCIDNVSITAN